MTEKYETIPVFPETKMRVDEFGKKNETYDELINRLLEIAKKSQTVSIQNSSRKGSFKGDHL